MGNTVIRILVNGEKVCEYKVTNIRISLSQISFHSCEIVGGVYCLEMRKKEDTNIPISLSTGFVGYIDDNGVKS